jgi:hypothetical protein
VKALPKKPRRFPYLSFNYTEPTVEHLTLLLLTPTIRIQEEEEERLGIEP